MKRVFGESTQLHIVSIIPSHVSRSAKDVSCFIVRTTGFPVDCSSRLLQYLACRGPIFVPTPVLKSFDQAADNSSMKNFITGETLVHFCVFCFSLCMFLFRP